MAERLWSIENVIEWLLNADPEAAIPLLSGRLGEAAASLEQVRTRLEADTKKGGWKGDVIVYEDVVSVIRDNPKCHARAAELLADLAAACTGPDAERFGSNLDLTTHPNLPVVRLPR